MPESAINNSELKQVQAPKSGSAIVRSPRLREAFFEDYPRLAALMSQYEMKPKSYPEWRHLWESNPSYLQFPGKWPLGWVLEVQDEIVGYFGNLPLRYELEGKPIIAAAGYGWVIDSRFRSYAILPLDYFTHQNQVQLYFLNTANIHASGTLMKFGACRVPVGQWDRSAVWITSYRHFVADWLARKVSPALSPLAYPLSAVLFVKDHILGRISHGEDEIETCNGFDERFDTFWQELRAKYPHRLMAIRTREHLEWHFHYAQAENRLWIFTIGDRSRLSAYGLFLKQKNELRGTSRILLVDYQSLDENSDTLPAMLALALQRCRSEGMDVLENIGLCIGGERLERLAPYQRSRPWSYYYMTDNHLQQTLNDPTVWAPSVFDGDASL